MFFCIRRYSISNTWSSNIFDISSRFREFMEYLLSKKFIRPLILHLVFKNHFWDIKTTMHVYYAFLHKHKFHFCEMKLNRFLWLLFHLILSLCFSKFSFLCRALKAFQLSAGFSTWTCDTFSVTLLLPVTFNS